MADGPAGVNSQGQGARGRRDQGSISSGDLEFLPDDLEDEGLSEEDLWDEMDAAEGIAPDEAAFLPEDVEVVETQSQEGDDELAAPSGETEEEIPPEAQQAADIWANASAEQRAAWEAAQKELARLEQHRRSNEGRVSALQLQINRLTEEQGRRRPGTAQPQGRGTGRAPQLDVGNAELEAVAKEYPEVARPFIDEFRTQRSHIQRQDEELRELKRQINAIGLDRANDAILEQTDMLLEVHPDALDLADDPAFRPWVDEQPRHIREAVSRNASAIVDAEEAADVIGRFKAFRSSQQAASDGFQEQDPNAGQRPTQGDPGTPLSDRRRRQLASSTSTRGKGPGVAAPGIPDIDDEDAIWDAMDRMEAAESRRSARV